MPKIRRCRAPSCPSRQNKPAPVHRRHERSANSQPWQLTGVISNPLIVFFGGRRERISNKTQRSQLPELQESTATPHSPLFFYFRRGENALKHARAPKQCGALLPQADSCFRLSDSPPGMFLCKTVKHLHATRAAKKPSCSKPSPAPPGRAPTRSSGFLLEVFCSHRQINNREDTRKHLRLHKHQEMRSTDREAKPN